MKNIITFSKDTLLLETLLKFNDKLEINNYNFEAIIENINFTNSVVIADIDDKNLNLTNFLEDLSTYAKSSILVLSINCDRKTINLLAKYGASSFIVKPLSKKRYKSHVLPYIESNSSVNELNFIEKTS